MNCLDFRRALLADPHRLDAGLVQHAAECPACRELHDRSPAWEAELADGLNVPVPDGLRYRVLGHIRRARASVVALACAASLVAAVALGLAVGWERNDALALAGIDFVVFEEAQAILDAKPAPPGMLGTAAAQVGVALPEFLGEMRYVCTLPFAEGMAYHVVAKTAFGKATLMLVPSWRPAARARASARGLTAIVAPTAGGSVTVIAPSSHGVERILTALMSRDKN